VISDRDHTYYTPPELAKRWRTGADKVRQWIADGELRGIDLSARRGGRPRWRVPLEAVLEFEQRRAAVPARPPGRRRRRPSSEVIEFF
jgi:excisionase family DNA binding protein